MFKRILFPTDLSESCEAPFRVAVEMAERCHSRLYIIHVLESRYSGKYRQYVRDIWTGEEIAVTGRYIHSVERHIKDFYAPRINGFTDYTIEVRLGFPHLEILRTARREHTDLIVMARHTGMARGLGVIRTFGAVASAVEDVMARAGCPVLVVDGPPERLDMFKKLLPLTNFSIVDDRAEELAVEIAKTFDGTPHVSHVSELISPPDTMTNDRLEMTVH
jgi:nucleotide-binding universal stress UspA family protein